MSNERPNFPGGLRGQFLLALCLLLVVGLGANGLIFARVLAQNTEAERARQADALASTLISLERGQYSVALDAAKPAFASRTGDGAPQIWGDEALASHLQKGKVGRFVAGGQSYVAASRERGDVSVTVAVRASVTDAVRDRNESLFWLFVLFASITLLAFAYAFFTYFVVRPVRAIGVASERASSGDLASPVIVLPRNEFGNVGRSFNQMLERLEQQRATLEERVAELATTNAELKTAQDSLIRSEKLASVGELSAGVAHEIGNPLAALVGFNEILRDGGLTQEEVDDLLSRTHVQLDRIQTIIRSLLDFSRPDSVGRTSTSLIDCVDEAVNLVTAAHRGRGLEIDVSGIGPELRADVVGAQLVQVLVNILLNAADALQDQAGGLVTMGVREEREWLILSIADNGPGIPEDVLVRIFDPFFTTKDPGVGTGLGLSISLRIMKTFDGDIQIESTPDEGTRFDLLLRPAK